MGAAAMGAVQISGLWSVGVAAIGVLALEFGGAAARGCIQTGCLVATPLAFAARVKLLLLCGMYAVVFFSGPLEHHTMKLQ